MNHPGYFKDFFGKSDVFRCAKCQYDTFEESKIIFHAKTAHPPVVLPETEGHIGEWANKESRSPRLKGKKVVIGLLTWNTAGPSAQAAGAVASEVARLRFLGVESSYCWVDNGSTDGTYDAVLAKLEPISQYGTLCHYETNVGQSKARNLMIDYALHLGADYLMMVDGDIEIIPYSAYGLTLCLDSGPATVGCVGIYCYNCTAVLDDAVAPDCRKIDPWMLSSNPGIAWTQFGVFRMKMFEEGVRFDTSPAFMGPGWGFEDDDLFMQMTERGYESLNTKYFRYLHRHRNSSLRILPPDVVIKSYEDRRKYLLNKWKDKASIHDIGYRLKLIANQTIPVIPSAT